MKTLLKVLSLLFISSAFAMQQNPAKTECCDQPVVECCQPAPGPYAFAFCADKGLACPAGFYAFGEFLYMQASEDGLDYGISYSPCDELTGGLSIPFPITNGYIEGFSNDNHSWHWNPGFRFGLGYAREPNCWTIEGVFTHINITNHHSTSLNGNGMLVPTWLPANPIRNGGEPVGSARWQTSFNTFDAHIMQSFHVSSSFVATPHFGLRFAAISQYYQAQYSAGWNQFATYSLPADAGVSMTANNDFWGIGTRAGIDTTWFLACGAGLYGNFSASLLFGKFIVDQSWLGSETNSAYANGNTFLLSDSLDEELYTNAPSFELETGIFWEKYFCEMKNRLLIKLGYEFHLWWDQNRMRMFTDSNSPIYNDTISRGDLSMNGLAFRVQLDF